MARRRYRRRRWYRPRRYYRRRYKRSAKLANNSSRSRLRVKVHVNYTTKLQFDDDNEVCRHPFIISPFFQNETHPSSAGFNESKEYCATTSMFDQQAFRNFALVYDEFKLDFMSCKFTSISSIGINGDFPRIRFVTAWDRNLCRGDIRDMHNFSMYDFEGGNAWQALNDSPSSVSVTAINNSIAKFLRFIRPSDLMEKIQWCDTQLYHNSNIVIRNDDQQQNMPSGGVVGWYNSEYTALPAFSPCLVLMAERFDPVETQVLNLQVDCTYVVTFRGPRFGQTSSAVSKSVGVVSEDRGLGPDGRVNVEPEGSLRASVHSPARKLARHPDGPLNATSEDGDAMEDDDDEDVFDRFARSAVRVPAEGTHTSTSMATSTTGQPPPAATAAAAPDEDGSMLARAGRRACEVVNNPRVRNIASRIGRYTGAEDVIDDIMDAAGAACDLVHH